jgi:septal ring factor EnvC (AmiA/AmiB activator)
MAPTVTEVDQRLTEGVRDFGQKLQSQGEKLAAIESSLVWITTIGKYFATLLVVIFGAIGTLSWNASALTSEMKQQGVRLAKVEDKLEQQGTRLDKVEQKLEQQGTRLDKVEQKLEQQGARLDKMDQKLEQQGARLDKMDQKLEQQGARLDKMDQKLDLIIQQLAQMAASKPKP